jgi:hypothetical protein
MATSFLEMFLEDVRLFVDDPVAGEKYTDTQVMRLAGLASRKIFRDLQFISSQPNVLSFDISVLTTVQVYFLPTGIGEILNIGEWDSTQDCYLWKIKTPSRRTPLRPNMFLSGRSVVFDALPDRAFTMRVEYLPSGDFSGHEANVNWAAAPTALNAFWLVDASSEAADLQRGVVDDRDGAYLGGMLRVWNPASSPTEIFERIITGHTVSVSGTAEQRRAITVDRDWDALFSAATVYRYEIVPQWIEGVRLLAVLGTAITLCTGAGMGDRIKLLEREYLKAARTERLAVANQNPDERTFRQDTDEGLTREMPW